MTTLSSRPNAFALFKTLNIIQQRKICPSDCCLVLGLGSSFWLRLGLGLYIHSFFQMDDTSVFNREFLIAAHFYSCDSTRRNLQYCPISHEEEAEELDDLETAAYQLGLGRALTKQGPPSYDVVGDILDQPDLLWADDCWDEARKSVALKELDKQGPPLQPFWRRKYEEKAGMFWNSFYKRNSTNFYKDRHYLDVVFPELSADYCRNKLAVQNKKASASCSDHISSFSPSYVRLLEVGCGVGNAIIPILESNPHISAVAIDFAQSAIQILSEHPLAKKASSNNSDGCTHSESDIDNATDNIQNEDATDNIQNEDANDYHTNCRIYPRLSAMQCCVVKDALPCDPNSMDLILCMFVLSALPPQSLRTVAQKLINALKPGGKILIRDYGRYDEAQLRFSRGSKLADNFYVRQDGTCSHFFDLDELVALFCDPNKTADTGSFTGDRSSLQQQRFASELAVTTSSSYASCRISSTIVNEDLGDERDVSVTNMMKVDHRCSYASSLRCEEALYIRRQYANRQQKVARHRVWIHAKLSKKS